MGIKDDDIMSAIGEDSVGPIELAERLESAGHGGSLIKRVSYGVLVRLWELVDRGDVEFTEDRRVRKSKQ